jgi:hypothetical protein
MYKMEHLVSGEWSEYSHKPVFERQPLSDGSARLLFGIPSGDLTVVRALLRCMEAPFWLLYVLKVPHGEQKAGRYESPLMVWRELDAFLDEFGAFLVADARFDLWISSPSSDSRIVWDEHNLGYAYGPLDSFESTIKGLGFTTGRPRIPVPHSHKFHPRFDPEAEALLAHVAWRHSPPRPEDEP